MKFYRYTYKSIAKQILWICLVTTSCASFSHGMDKENPVFKGKLSPTKIMANPLMESLKYQIQHHKKDSSSKTLTPLSYDEFRELQRKGVISSKQAGELIDHAYAVGNPILYRKADQKILPEEYTINFLWLHNKKQAYQEKDHLLGNDMQKFMQCIYQPIFKWQSKQPQAQLNYWYDSAMLPDNPNKFIENTRHLLKGKNINIDHVKFCDIRQLKVFEKHSYAQWLFSQDTPVYFRVDLLKAIITDHEIEKKGIKHAVLPDLDFPAITADHLFDDLTLKQLNLYGYIFCRDGMGNQENGFMILSKGNIKDQHYKEVIVKGIDYFTKKYIRHEEVDPQAIFFDILSPFKKNCENQVSEKLKNAPYRYKHLTPGKPMLFEGTHFQGFNGYRAEVVKVLEPALEKFQKPEINPIKEVQGVKKTLVNPPLFQKKTTPVTGLPVKGLVKGENEVKKIIPPIKEVPEIKKVQPTIVKPNYPLMGLNRNDGIKGVTNVAAFLSGEKITPNMIQGWVKETVNKSQDQQLPLRLDLAKVLGFSPNQKANVSFYNFGEIRFIMFNMDEIKNNYKRLNQEFSTDDLIKKLSFLKKNFPIASIGKNDLTGLSMNKSQQAPLKLKVHVGECGLYFGVAPFLA